MHARIFLAVLLIAAATSAGIACGQSSVTAVAESYDGANATASATLYGSGNLFSAASGYGPGSCAQSDIVGRGCGGGWVNGQSVGVAVNGYARSQGYVEAIGPGTVANLQNMANAYCGNAVAIGQSRAYGMTACSDVANTALAHCGSAVSDTVGTAEGYYGGSAQTYGESIADARYGGAYNVTRVGACGRWGGRACARALNVNQGFGYPSYSNVCTQSQAYYGGYGQAQSAYLP
jgi:hypothetical protein